MNTLIKTKERQKMADWLTSPQFESKKEKHFSADEVIDAYFRGKRARIDENKKVLLKAFSDNLEQAKKVCEEFFAALGENDIKGLFVSLRAESVTTFDAIFVVPKQKFISRDFVNIAYSMAREKKNEINTPTFDFSFAFMPFTESLDERSMLMDGYILKYGKI